MKITFVLEYFYPFIGGIEILFKKIAEGMVKKGIDCNIVTSHLRDKNDNIYTKTFEVINGVKIYRIKTPRLYHRYWFSIMSISAIWNVARDSDLIHTTTYTGAFPALVVSKALDKPCIITVHEFLGKNWSNFFGVSILLGKFFRGFERFLMALPFDMFVGVSNNTVEDLKKSGVKNVETIYNGIDYGLFNPRKASGRKIRKKLGVKNNEFLVMYFGRPGGSKGVEYLIRSIPIIIKKIPKVKFLFNLSKEPHYRRKMLVEQIDKLDMSDKITVIEPVKRKELPNYIASANCIVVPSLSEGFGFTAAEACAMEKIVIASNTASLPEVVSGKYILVKPKDHNGIANAVYKAFKKRYRKSKKKKFEWKTCIDNYYKLYDRIINH